MLLSEERGMMHLFRGTEGKGSWYVCHATVSLDTYSTADKSDFQVNNMHGAGQKTLQC